MARIDFDFVPHASSLLFDQGVRDALRTFILLHVYFYIRTDGGDLFASSQFAE